jgi:hypothetical protein
MGHFWKAIQKVRTARIGVDLGPVDAIVRLLKGEDVIGGRIPRNPSDDSSPFSERAVSKKLRRRRGDRGDVRHG